MLLEPVSGSYELIIYIYDTYISIYYLPGN